MTLSSRPGRPVDGAEPHVAGGRVVVGRRVAHDPEPEHVAVERDAALDVGADQRDVVQPRELHAAPVSVGHQTLKPTPVRRLNAVRNAKKPAAKAIRATTTISAGATCSRASTKRDHDGRHGRQQRAVRAEAGEVVAHGGVEPGQRREHDAEHDRQAALRGRCG